MQADSVAQVVLRRLQVSDLRAFQAYRSDPVVARYQGWKAQSDAEASAFLAEMRTAAFFQPGKWTQIGIAGGDGHLMGDIGVLLARDGREAEIGFTLRRESQGHGHGTAAVRLAIDLIFEQTGARRILGITDARNLASVRVLQSVGMSMIESRGGITEDEPCIEHVYALSR